VKESKELQHVIGLAVSDVEELPIGPARYIRTFNVRTLLGDEFVLTLRSESRLGLALEMDRPAPVVLKPKARRRKDDRRPESS
jgi:hypothetical protein